MKFELIHRTKDQYDQHQAIIAAFPFGKESFDIQVYFEVDRKTWEERDILQGRPDVILDYETMKIAIKDFRSDENFTPSKEDLDEFREIIKYDIERDLSFDYAPVTTFEGRI